MDLQGVAVMGQVVVQPLQMALVPVSQLWIVVADLVGYQAACRKVHELLPFAEEC